MYWWKCLHCTKLLGRYDPALGYVVSRNRSTGQEQYSSLPAVWPCRCAGIGTCDCWNRLELIDGELRPSLVPGPEAA